MSSHDESGQVDAGLEVTLRRMLAAGDFDLPLPASGSSAERLACLAGIARRDLQVARMAEVHTDAIAILCEARRTPRSDALYGVWAAEDPSSRLELVEASRFDTDVGSRVLRGTKAFCTGSSLLDRALVTVRGPSGVLLVDVDLRQPRVAFDASTWRTPAFRDTVTAVATFDDVAVNDTDIVGPPGWYLDRVGFWHGACGPAACWAGGALGLVDHAIAVASAKSPAPHLDAQVGALAALGWSLAAFLDVAGHEIDQCPGETSEAMQRARMLRHRVERTVTEVIDLHGRAVGPRSLIQDTSVLRRVEELQLYVRQHHGERDLEAIGIEARRTS